MPRLPYLLCSLTLFASQFVRAQDCGTKSPSPAIYEHTRDVVSTYSVSPSLNGGTTCIPLQAHIVRASDGSGGISLLDLNIGLSFLNHLYLDAGIEFFWKGLPNYVNNDDYFEYDQQSPDNDTESGLVGLFTTATNATNIYFVNNITTSNGFVAAGYAYFPFNSAQSNRVVMRHGSTASTLNGTFAHEFGHYFNLFHTHEGTEFGNTDPNAENVPRVGASANCGTDGDLLCDTDADPRYNSGAFDFGTCMDTGGETDVNSVPYIPPVDNIMSYYPDQCGGIFTADQYTRIAQGLIARQGHSAYSLTAAPMAVAAPTGLNVTLAGSALDLSWNDVATNEMGYLIERSTTSGTAGFRAVPGAVTGPGGNSWSDMDVISNTTYWYRAKATNGDCNAYSNVASFTTGLFYCTPSYSSPCDAGVAELGVGSFSLTGATSSITNNNSGCSTEGYMDNTGLSAAVVAGNSYNFSASAIDIGGGSYYSTLLQIWVDLDQNGSFLDVGEQMLASEATLAFTFNGSITIPATALNGTTRMRVRAWDPFNPCVATPCNQCAFGETEDYSLVISGGVDPFIQLTAKVLLEGPYNGVSMDDDLRSAGLVPTSEPYGAIFGHVGDGGGETVSPTILSGTGSNAIVDWVYLELRDKNDNSSILNTRSALLQADGDVVDTDGISPVSFTSPADDYFVVVRHRNHLGTMSAIPVNFSPGASVDFTSSAGSSYGSNAKKNISGTFVLWLGNALVDDVLKYIGSSNDRDAILVRIGGSVPTSTVSGYYTEDCNMDGTVKYIGSDNDRDPILINLGGSVPTNTRAEQLP